MNSPKASLSDLLRQPGGMALLAFYLVVMLLLAAAVIVVHRRLYAVCDPHSTSQLVRRPVDADC